MSIRRGLGPLLCLCVQAQLASVLMYACAPSCVYVCDCKCVRLCAMAPLVCVCMRVCVCVFTNRMTTVSGQGRSVPYRSVRYH